MRGLLVRDSLWRACCDDLPTAGASFGPQINNPVSGFDDVQIVLDDDDGVAAIPEPMQHLKELPYVVKVQTRSGLIKDIEGVASIALGQLSG